MIRALLVDDEQLALDLLTEFTGRLDDLEVSAAVRSPIAALEILHRESIDLLFLDIQMPHLSGNKLLRTLQRPPVTIFTTAYSDYAVEAFELDAADYLLKPFGFERFLQAVNRARAKLNSNPTSAEQITGPQTSDLRDQGMVLKVDGKLIKVPYDNIVLIEGLREYVRIRTRDGRQLVTLETLSRLERELPEAQFMRVHRSWIVNRRAVTGLDGNLLDVREFRVPVSRSRRTEVVAALFDSF